MRQLVNGKYTNLDNWQTNGLINKLAHYLN